MTAYILVLMFCTPGEWSCGDVRTVKVPNQPSLEACEKAGEHTIQQNTHASYICARQRKEDQ